MISRFVRRAKRTVGSNPLYQRWLFQRYMRQQMPRNAAAVEAGTEPGALFFAQEVCRLLGRETGWLAETAAEYCASPEAWKRLSGLRSTTRAGDGYTKTLDVAEGFALWALVKHLRPRVVVELGTQFGISARLWKEALNAYVPGHRLYLCDLVDKRRFIGDDEATLLKGDARELLKPLWRDGIDILHNDAHPWDFICWSLETGLAEGVPCFTFHDVGGERLRGGPFRSVSAMLPHAEIERHNDDFHTYGTWERRAMGDFFAPAILTQDWVEAAPWKVQVFDSLFGFGAALREGRGG